jgi:hypothetical protein
MLTYFHVWVQSTAGRLLGHYFANVKESDKAVVNTLQQKYVLLASPENLFLMARNMCTQMTSQLLTTPIAQQIIKNLVFVSSVLRACPAVDVVPASIDRSDDIVQLESSAESVAALESEAKEKAEQLQRKREREHAEKQQNADDDGDDENAEEAAVDDAQIDVQEENGTNEQQQQQEADEATEETQNGDVAVEEMEEVQDEAEDNEEETAAEEEVEEEEEEETAAQEESEVQETRNILHWILRRVSYFARLRHGPQRMSVVRYFGAIGTLFSAEQLMPYLMPMLRCMNTISNDIRVRKTSKSLMLLLLFWRVDDEKLTAFISQVTCVRLWRRRCTFWRRRSAPCRSLRCSTKFVAVRCNASNAGMRRRRFKCYWSLSEC